MLSDRKKRNILVWFIIAVICVSYLGTEGLYNSKVRNYSAGLVATLGGNRSIDSGNNDMLGVADISYGLSIQQRNLNPGSSEKKAEPFGMPAFAVFALLLGLVYSMSAFAGGYASVSGCGRWMLLIYIHKKDGKKRLGCADEGYLRCCG